MDGRLLVAAAVLPATVLSRSVQDFQCLEGKRYVASAVSDTLIGTNECCTGFVEVGGACLAETIPPVIDPQVVSRFITAICMLLVVCVVVAIVSMLIAYTMFYKRSRKDNESERVTLAGDLDASSSRLSILQ